VSDDELRALDWACHQQVDDPVLRRYSTDPAAARSLEDEIERRSLQSEYVWALAELLFVADDEWGTAHVMKMIRATPEQKCRAFLEATK
jgi:hypothetical protein